MATSIPRVIHQTWRDREIPPGFRAFQESWTRHHPGWEYRLWTDSDLRRLVCERYPWFLSIYDDYAEPIERVDAARYFVMHCFGGVYVDLDFECLRPIDELLHGQELIVGLEPQAHLYKPVVKAHGLDRVVGNAFLASRPGHRFWEHLFQELVGARHRSGPLEVTGPFLLTRALESYVGQDAVSCASAERLYPATSTEAAEGLTTDRSWRERAAASAYAIHHWSGSWIGSSPGASEGTPVLLTVRGKSVLKGDFTFPGLDPVDSLPSVSCLMVTRSSRLAFARRAIACFQAQTYPAKELLIVDDGPDEDLVRHLEESPDSRIRLARLPAENLPLGALRNIAVARASGEYVTQWDDDDLAHPHRIELQMGVLGAVGADACLLSRWQIWWPRRRRLATSKRRAWEGSLLCARHKVPSYDERLRRGEDTPVVLRLASREKVAFLDAPWLYTYVVHGENTTAERMLEDHWAQATEVHSDSTYPTELRRLAAALPAPVGAEVIAHLDGDQGQCLPHAETARASR